MRDYESMFGKELEGTVWTVLGFGQDKRFGPRSQKYRSLRCRCRCGVERDVMICHLFPNIKTQSCGCLQDHGGGRRTHGMTDSREYRIWRGLVKRCHSPNHVNFRNYGARGIAVCDEWRGVGGFARFLEHVGPCPSAEAQLDRIDNNGNYVPGNVRWTTREGNNNNRRNNRLLTFRGETKTAAEWARTLNLPAYAIRQRLKRGWSIEKALTTPLLSGQQSCP
jgi:hypothetical protein